MARQLCCSIDTRIFDKLQIVTQWAVSEYLKYSNESFPFVTLTLMFYIIQYLRLFCKILLLQWNNKRVKPLFSSSLQASAGNDEYKK